MEARACPGIILNSLYELFSSSQGRYYTCVFYYFGLMIEMYSYIEQGVQLRDTGKLHSPF